MCLQCNDQKIHQEKPAIILINPLEEARKKIAVAPLENTKDIKPISEKQKDAS